MLRGLPGGAGEGEPTGRRFAVAIVALQRGDRASAPDAEEPASEDASAVPQAAPPERLPGDAAAAPPDVRRDPTRQEPAVDHDGAGTSNAGAAEGAAQSSGQRVASAGAGGQPPSLVAPDLRPWCRTCPVPDYPARARRRGWQGTVDVDLELNGDGSVRGAHVVRSSGFPALDEAAVAVARRSRFRVPEARRALHGKLRYRFRLERSL